MVKLHRGTLIKGTTVKEPPGGLVVESMTNLNGEEVINVGINPQVGKTRVIMTGLRTLRRGNFDNTCVISSKSETRWRHVILVKHCS